MKEKHIQIISIVVSLLYFGLIVWIYSAQPKNLIEAINKAAVSTGTYSIDRGKFEEGLQLFRQESYPRARDLFTAADPEKRDPKIQFYVAYSFYREGWGRFASDDALYQLGLEAANHVEKLDSTFSSDDPGLILKTPSELKIELEKGTKTTFEDLNPLKVLRERK